MNIIITLINVNIKEKYANNVIVLIFLRENTFVRKGNYIKIKIN